MLEQLKGINVNMQHKQNSLGKYNRGAKNGMAKLEDIDVIIIKKRLKSGCTQKSLAKYYNISVQHINAIKHNKRWGHIHD